MPLVDLELPPADDAPPAAVRSFLREANDRIERYQMTSRTPAFVPSDYAGAYVVLAAVATANLAPGPRFCEWGSGFGVIASLAAMLDYEACGIEIDADLVAAARTLADDFDLSVQFARDSFIPPGGEAYADVAGSFSWLTADDFDVIFAYPWPDEEWVIEGLFDRYAAVGAVLITYHGGEGFRVRRKMSKKRGRAAKARRRAG
jgi:hypothetical protein